MGVPTEIRELTERFERNKDAYRSPQYNETQLRREFLDPFFKALGWDIDNEQGYAEAYKDVIHEDAIKVGEATKAPDYCFRIGGARKFFLEAKRPSVDIKHDVGPAFQLRRYGFTTKLPLNILSDFEAFAVYDCRFKPDQHDIAAAGRILYIPYTDYAGRWDEIAGIFSRDAVLKGAFDKFAESTKAKRGTAAVDDEFLKTIEGWRASLARNLALRNPNDMKVPVGRPTIARRFNGGFRSFEPVESRRDERKHRFVSAISAVPSGLSPFVFTPTVKTVGLFSLVPPGLWAFTRHWLSGCQTCGQNCDTGQILSGGEV